MNILVITESKTDSTFPLNQFATPSYSKPYKFDRNRNGERIKHFCRHFLQAFSTIEILKSHVNDCFKINSK